MFSPWMLGFEQHSLQAGSAARAPQANVCLHHTNDRICIWLVWHPGRIRGIIITYLFHLKSPFCITYRHCGNGGISVHHFHNSVMGLRHTSIYLIKAGFRKSWLWIRFTTHLRVALIAQSVFTPMSTDYIYRRRAQDVLRSECVDVTENNVLWWVTCPCLSIEGNGLDFEFVRSAE